MPIIPAGFGEVVFRYTFPPLDPDVMVCTLGIELDGPASSLTADLIALCDGWHDTAGNNLTNDLRWDTCFLHANVAEAGRFTFEALPSDLSPGQSGTTGISTKNAVIVQKRTPLGGRRGRGRMFWAGAITTHVDDQDNLNSVGMAAWQTQLTAFLDAFPFGSILRPVILHTTGGGSPPIITSMTPSRLTGTMRRRYRN